MRTPEDLTELWQRTLDAGRTVLPGTSSGARSGLPLSVDVQGFGAVRAIAQGDVMPGPCAIFQVAGEWLAISQSATQSVRRNQIEFRRRRGVQDPEAFGEIPIAVLVTRQSSLTLLKQYELWVIFGELFSQVRIFPNIEDAVDFDTDPLEIQQATFVNGAVNYSETISGDSVMLSGDVDSGTNPGGNSAAVIESGSGGANPFTLSALPIEVPPTTNLNRFDADLSISVDKTSQLDSRSVSELDTFYEDIAGQATDTFDPSTGFRRVIVGGQSSDIPPGAESKTGKFLDIGQIVIGAQAQAGSIGSIANTAEFTLDITNAIFNRILTPDQFELFWDGTNLILWVKGEKLNNKRPLNTAPDISTDNFFYGANIDPTDLSLIEERLYLESDAVAPVAFGPEPFDELLAFGSPTATDPCVDFYTFSTTGHNLVPNAPNFFLFQSDPTKIENLLATGRTRTEVSRETATPSGPSCNIAADSTESLRLRFTDIETKLGLTANDTYQVIDVAGYYT